MSKTLSRHILIKTNFLHFSIDEYGLAEFSPFLAQEHAAVLAGFAPLVDDCAMVDPNHPTNVLLGSNLVI